MTDLRGKTALVTGASSGIGAEMARQLAARGCDLVISARRAERLEALASELDEAHGAGVRVISMDLGEPGSAGRLYDEATRGGDARLDILINNAGFGAYQRLNGEPWPRQAQMLQLNVTSLAELTYRFVEDALERDGDSAWVLNVASVVGFFSMPFFSTYAGTKAFVIKFSESLSMELCETPVQVTCLCPGGTATEFSDVAGQRLNKMARKSLMSAERCARIGLEALFRGKRTVVTGFSNKLMVFLRRLLPPGVIGRIASRVIGEPVAPGELPAAGEADASERSESG